MDVDLAHRDAVVARIAEDLRGRIEPHRLAVQERRGECGRVVPLEPGARIDEQRETRRMRLGKPVAGEPLDLLEHLQCELARIPTRDHAALEGLAELRDPVSLPLPGGDGTTEFVGLSGREPGGHHGERHRLLLEQRYAERLAQHLANRVIGIRDGLLAASPTQVWVDHVSLDRSRPHDRNLDHQVVEAPWAQPRKHRHLRPGLDLEYADGIGLADHVVGRWILGGDGMETQRRGSGRGCGCERGCERGCRYGHGCERGRACRRTDAHEIHPCRRGLGSAEDRRSRRDRLLVAVHQVDRLANRGQHAEREDIDLEHAQRLDVVLVPLDDGAVLHRGVLDGNRLDQRSARDDETAHVLRPVPREAEEFVDEPREPDDQRRGGIESRGLHALGGPRGKRRQWIHGRRRSGCVARGALLREFVARPESTAAPPVDLLRDTLDGVGREGERPSDIAHRTSATVADDLAHQRRTVASVPGVDVLDDLLATLVLEVDVDVGRLVALAAHEALEQDIDAVGIDGGHAEREADRAVRRGAAPLAEDPARPRERHDLVHRQEVRRVAEVGDDRELVLELTRHLLRNPARIALARPAPGQVAQVLHRGHSRGNDLVRILVAQLGERERRRPLDETPGRLHRLRAVAVAASDLVDRPEPPLGVRRQQPTGALHGHACPYARERVEQFAPRRVVHADIAARDHRHAQRVGERTGPLGGNHALGIVRPAHGHGDAVAHDPRESLRRLEEWLRWNAGRHQHREKAAATGVVVQHPDKVVDQPRARTALDRAGDSTGSTEARGCMPGACGSMSDACGSMPSAVLGSALRVAVGPALRTPLCSPRCPTCRTRATRTSRGKPMAEQPAERTP